MNTEEFVQKARIKHGDKYDYSLVEYKNNREHVKIICPIHGVFEQTPNVHIGGHGCPKCYFDGRKKLVFGVGINDSQMSICQNNSNIPSYTHWVQMLKRCYSQKYHFENKTYSQCKVCDEWLRFSLFEKWFNENYKDGYELDKDILVKGNKIYSPATCCFVPKYINLLLLDGGGGKRNLKRGVYLGTHSNKFKVTFSKYGKLRHVGVFDTEDDAYDAYIKEKYNHIKEVAIKALKKGEINERVYKALITYKI